MRMAVFIPLNGTFPKVLCVERNCSISEMSSNLMRIPRLFSMRSSLIRTPWGGVVTLRNKPRQKFHLTQVAARLEEASLHNIAVLPETSENVWCDSKRVSRISWKSPDTHSISSYVRRSLNQMRKRLICRPLAKLISILQLNGTADTFSGRLNSAFLSIVSQLICDQQLVPLIFTVCRNHQPS